MEYYDFTTLLQDIIFTAAIYSGPILLYRYAIKKESVEIKTAKAVAILYAIVSLIVMSLILVALETGDHPGVAWLMWSYVNYRVLLAGHES